MGDVRRTKSSNQKSNNNYHPTDATKRMLQLEATNAALQTALSSKNAHITMLEERLLKMSVEFASSRASEDEQNLKYRRSTQADDGIIMMVPTTSDAGIFPNPIRNTKISGRRRRGSRGSSVSPCPTDHQVQAAADLIDASIKSAPPPTQQTTTRRFSIKSSSRGSSNNNNNNRAPQDDLSDSARSLGSTGVCNFIGNIINNIDRSDRSDDLNVNFPTGRRRSSMMSGSTGNNNINNSQPQAEQRRESIVEQLFRLRNKSELTADDAVEEICEQEEEEEPQQQHEEEEEEEQAPPQRRRPNRSNMLKYQASTRLLSSTLIFPKEDDDDSLGFE